MKRNLISLVLALTAVAATAVAVQGALVLADGTRLEVTRATVENGLVYATFANGSMQAFPVEDVDLVASELLPAPAATPAAKRAPTIADAQATVTGDGVITTDDDVEHVTLVEPAAAVAEDEKKPESPATSLLISDVQRQIAAGMANISGKVKNAGRASVAFITLTATALEGEREAGKGSTTITQELKPQAEVGFALTFPVEGLVDNIQLRAQAVVTDFDFSQLPAPTPAPREETPPSGG